MSDDGIAMRLRRIVRRTHVRVVLFLFAYFSEVVFKKRAVLVGAFFRFSHRDVATADKRFGVQLADRFLGFDRVVHERLREAGIVAFIVTTTAVAK